MEEIGYFTGANHVDTNLINLQFYIGDVKQQWVKYFRNNLFSTGYTTDE